MRAIRISKNGGPEVLSYEEVEAPEPEANEVVFRVEAAGINFIDVYQRTGLYPVPLPTTLGLEAAGVVLRVGDNVTRFHVGDRIASAKVCGAYAEQAVVAESAAVRVPEGIESATAAALMLQGMTAHYLACDVFPLKPGDSALVHAAAGGVGLLLTQIAKRRGARVVAVVGSEAKVLLACEAGAEEVVVSGKGNFAEVARLFTKNRGVDVVYDSVGKDTFEGSLASLRPRGMMVSFGNASGPVPPFSPLILSQKGSLFFTRPTLGHYTETIEEIQKRVDDLFGWVAAGELKVRIGATIPLAEAAAAHHALESRETTGKVLLIP
ncbi:MAG: quinone oxidoreductase [Nibricoccus sp.]